MEKGIYFVPSIGLIEFFPFATSKPLSVLVLAKDFFPTSVSPDGRWMLLFKLNPAESDLMLVEDFR